MFNPSLVQKTRDILWYCGVLEWHSVSNAQLFVHPLYNFMHSIYENKKKVGNTIHHDVLYMRDELNSIYGLPTLVRTY